MDKFVKRFRLSLVVFAAICWLTLSPEPVGKVQIELFAGADKVIHACMMGGLTATILFDLWRPERRMPGGKAMILTTVAVVTIFSVADEWAQGVMGLGRTSDIYDFVADISGMAVALLLTPPVLRRFSHKK